MPLQPAFDLVSFNCNRLGLHWFSSEKLSAGRCRVLELLCEQTEDAKSWTLMPSKSSFACWRRKVWV